MLCTFECHTENGGRNILHHQMMEVLLLFQGTSLCFYSNAHQSQTLYGPSDEAVIGELECTAHQIIN